MILYVYDLKTQAYPLLLHRLSVNAKKEACLLINQRTYLSATENDYPYALKKSGVFSEIFAGNLSVGKVPPKSNPEDRVIAHFDKMFEELGCKPADFDEIYLANDALGAEINIYFNVIKQPYYWVEAVKDLCRLQPNYLANIGLVELFKQLNAMNVFAEYAIPVLRTDSETSQMLCKSKHYLTWDFDSALSSISDESILAVADTFWIDVPDNAPESAMVVTNSNQLMLQHIIRQPFCISSEYGASSPEKNVQKQKDSRKRQMTTFIDKLALDFFAPEKMQAYLKNHPHSPWTQEEVQAYYGDWCHVFTDMPFQFMTRYLKLKEIKFGTILGYHSTSLEALDGNVCDKQVILGDSFLKTWFYYTSLYAVVVFLSENPDMFEKIYAQPHIAEQFNLLCEVNSLDIQADVFTALSGKKPNAIYIADDSAFVGAGLLNNERLLTFIKPSVFLLNMEASPACFSEELLPSLTALTVRKIPHSGNVQFPCRPETAWFVTKNTDFADKLHRFSMTKILPKTGITFSVAKTSFAHTVEQYECFEQRVVRRKTIELEKQLGMTQRLVNALLDLPKLDKLCIFTRSCNDFVLYCDILRTLASRYLVIVAVRDTPGNNISPEITDRLGEVGFTDFRIDLWCMYIGIAYKGAILFQQSGEREVPLKFDATDLLDGTSLVVSSEPWRKGDKAEIIINGADYAVNGRGLNIVVYDVQKKKLIDSVAFDWHDLIYNTFR